LLGRDAALDGRAAALAAVLLVETAPGARPDTRAALLPAWPLALRCEIGGRALAVTLTRRGARCHDALIDGQTHPVEIVSIAGQQARFICDGVMETASWQRDGERLWLSYRGVSFEVIDTTREAIARHAGAAGDGQLRASMNGRVVAVLVEVGQRVAAGQPIVTLEAMKMEHVHAAPLAGTVKALHVSAGDQVAARRVVAEIDAGAAVPQPTA